MPNTYSTNIQFGAGYIYGVNVGGAQPAVIVPGKFATIQEASVEFSFTIKELMGNLEFAEDIASGSKKISGKITTGRIDLNLLNQVVFADVFGTGATLTQNVEPHTVPGSPFQVTIAPPGSGVFSADLGVYYAATGIQLGPVASSPGLGQYTINTGTGLYTFNTADSGAAVLINYTYTVTTGHSLTVTNKIIGNSRPVFALYLSQPYQGNNDLVLYACRASKLNIPEKREDYTILEIDFSAFANAAGNVFQWNTAA